MRQTAIALVLFATASALFAFDPSRGARIAVLDSSSRYAGADVYVAAVIERRLCEELRDRGFEAFQTAAPLGQLVPFDAANADYYIELVGSGGGSTAVADAAVGGNNFFIDFGLVVSHVAARLRLYDGRTLELLRTFNLRKANTAFVPVGVGGWSGRVAFSVAAPARWLQERTAMRGIAQDAAKAVVVALHNENE